MSNPTNQDEELKLTLELLNQSFTAKDNAKQKEILIKLKELYDKNTLNHFQLLIKGLTLDNTTVPLDLKKSIAIYINTLIQSHREALDSEALLELLKFVIQATMLSDYIESIEPFFYKTISLIIGSKCLTNNFAYLKGLFDFLQSTIAQCPHDQLCKQGKGLINIIKLFIKCAVINADGISMISAQMFSIIDSFFSLVPNYINNTTGINIQFVEILQIIFEFFIDFIKKSKLIKKENSISIMFLFEKYGKYTWELINLNIGNNSGNVIIYLTNDIDLNNQINLMKGKAIQFIAAFINAVGFNLKDNDLIVYTSNLINVSIAAIDNLIKGHFILIQGLREKHIKNGLHSLVYSMSIYLSRALIRNPIKEEFTPFVNNLILNIIFPLLLSSPKDVNEIMDDGENYFNYINDLVEDHEIKTCRTSMSFLLQKICEHYGFLSSLIINFTLKYLEALLSDNKTDLSQNQFLMLLDSNSPIITLEYEYKIDFCLLILIILKDYVVENSLFKQAMRSILLNYHEKLNGINSILVSDKLCLFYGTYLQIIFEQENNNDDYKLHSIVFNYLMNILLNYTKYVGLGFQSANAIYDLLYESNIGKAFIFSDTINQNISKINMLIEESDVHLFHLILVYIADKIEFNSEEEQYNFLSKITKRMQKEILFTSNEMPHFLEKGFAILNKTLYRKQLTNDKNRKVNIESFEAMISPIVMYIKNPNKISFFDEIIDLMKNEIISAQMIPSLPLSILPFLQLACKKNKMISETEFSYLCAFFKYDNNGECTNQLLNEILFLIYLGYQLEQHDIPRLSLLLTIGLLSGNNAIYNDTTSLKSLLAKAYENIAYWELKQSQNQIDDSNEFALITSLAVICTSMISNPIVTFDFLNETEKVKSFISNLVHLLKIKFSSTKLMKQIILGLCSLVHNAETRQKLIQMQSLNTILQCLLHYTHKQKKEDTAYVKKLMKKEISCNFINNEAENLNDFDLNDYEMYLNDNELNKNYYSKFIRDNEGGYDIDMVIKEVNYSHENIDEYLIFSQCVKGLESVLVENFVKDLTDYEKQMLTEITLIKKVDVVYHEKKISVPRRTVKIRRSQGDANNNQGENNDIKNAS